jgi:hypothetical protein
MACFSQWLNISWDVLDFGEPAGFRRTCGVPPEEIFAALRVQRSAVAARSDGTVVGQGRAL